MRPGYKEFKEKCQQEGRVPEYIAYLWATHREAGWKTYPDDGAFRAWIDIKHRSFQRKHPGLDPKIDAYETMFLEWLDYRCVEERRTK